MHINQFIAKAAGLSRRKADAAVAAGRVSVDGRTADIGQQVREPQRISLDGRNLPWRFKAEHTIMLNKPPGYVSSRNGQGRKTVYELLPGNLHFMNVVGRLDKNSSGLLLLTSDGQLAYRLTHPKFEKPKTYTVRLDKTLSETDRQAVEAGVELEDGKSRLRLERMKDGTLTVTMHEGRNRQIRRTFAALGYNVLALHRETFGDYELGNLASGQWKDV